MMESITTFTARADYPTLTAACDDEYFLTSMNFFKVHQLESFADSKVYADSIAAIISRQNEFFTQETIKHLHANRFLILFLSSLIRTLTLVHIQCSKLCRRDGIYIE